MPVPSRLAEALPIARQIAEGLEAAHDKGIIHRDLKPANIKLTAEGKVKVLDFGLAKAFENEPMLDPANAPTLTIGARRAGTIRGTPGYMSPEQARGLTVDKRTDIWAYGVVVYEMLTGREMFSGETISDALAAVPKSDVGWSALPAEKPAPVRRLLRRCLERERNKRLRDIGDALADIDEVPARHAALSPKRKLPSAVAAVLAVLALALALLHFRETPPAERVLRLSVSLPEGRIPGHFDLSPDGRDLVLGTAPNYQLSLRALDSMEFKALSGADGGRYPFWSPDGRYIGFFANGKLKTIPVGGGPAQVLCDVTGLGRGGTWNRDGVILFADQGSTSGVFFFLSRLRYGIMQSSSASSTSGTGRARPYARAN